MKVKTVKAGSEYTVTLEDGKWFRLMLDSERGHVFVYTKTATIGGYDINRFGGELSAATVRKFWEGK